MGALREKMIEEITLRSFAPRTQKSYVAAMVGLARHYRQFPDQLTQEQIRTSTSIVLSPPARCPWIIVVGSLRTKTFCFP